MKNAEAAISSRRGSLRTGEELKNFGTGGGVTFAGGGQYHITCHGTPSYFKKTKLTLYNINFIQLLNSLFKVG